MRVLKIIYRIVLGSAALACVAALQAQSPSDFLAVRKVMLDPATSNMLLVVQNVGERRITGCAVLVGSQQYTQEFVYSVGMDPQVLRSRPAGFGGLEPGEMMQLLFPPSGSGGPPAARINAVILEDRTAVGEEEQIASMFRQRLAYASEWGRWALVMGEDPAHPRSDVVREAEIAEMIRVLPEDPDKSGSAAAVAGRMAARRALRSLLMQSKPETRAPLLAYVQDRAATLREHARREGPIGYIAPAVALVNDTGKPCEAPGAGPVITQESLCGLPGAPFHATARATPFCVQASGGHTAKTSGSLSAAALGSCGAGAPQDRTYMPECKPEFFTTTSSSASSATITGMTSSYVPAAGCTIVGSQSATVLITDADDNRTMLSDTSCTLSISAAQSINDGSGASFTATAQGGSPSNYVWSFSAPAGAGNGPNVVFANPAGASTSTDGHWFAYPDEGCTASTVSTYSITVSARIDGYGPFSATTSLSINVPWAPAGRTAPPYFSNFVYRIELRDGRYYILDLGNTTRMVPAPTIYVAQGSQFYNKTMRHEQVHVSQYQPGGLNGQYMIVSDFAARVIGLNDATEEGLDQQFNAALDQYLSEQRGILLWNSFEAERQAYAVSDELSPRYIYQNCDRY